MGSAGPDQLRQGAARPACTRLARRLARPLPQRPGGLRELTMDALELAGRALRAAEGDEALALVTRERSGLARFASSEVHQPTLIENEVVELQIVRDGCVGLAAVDGASGYAEQTAWRVGDVDPAETARRATEKAERTRGAIELEPGSYAAVLEPYAFAELLLYFGYDAFGARGLIEERSFASGRIGEKVFDERFSLADDPLDARGLPKAFDFEGSPKRRVELVENGVLTGVLWDRRTAREAGGGQETTGSAPPATARDWGPLPFALSVAGGEAGTAEELAELVGDGIYVTRLHYLSIVNPREGVITGMTRDGTFRIRGGRIADPLVNLRFTVSVPQLLAELHGLTREPTLVNETSFYDERYPNGVLAPAVATARFDITGIGGGPGV